MLRPHHALCDGATPARTLSPPGWGRDQSPLPLAAPWGGPVLAQAALRAAWEPRAPVRHAPGAEPRLCVKRQLLVPHRLPSSLHPGRRRKPATTCSGRSRTSKESNEHQRDQNSIATASSSDECWPSAKASSQNFVQESGLSMDQTDKVAGMAGPYRAGTPGNPLSHLQR